MDLTTSERLSMLDRRWQTANARLGIDHAMADTLMITAAPDGNLTCIGD